MFIRDKTLEDSPMSYQVSCAAGWSDPINDDICTVLRFFTCITWPGSGLDLDLESLAFCGLHFLVLHIYTSPDGNSRHRIVSLVMNLFLTVTLGSRPSTHWHIPGSNWQLVSKLYLVSDGQLTPKKIFVLATDSNVCASRHIFSVSGCWERNLIF